MTAATPKSRAVRLVIADVDGTLVTQEKVLTQRAIEAVDKMRRAGIALAVTSGRPPLGMKMLVEVLQHAEFIAGFNGGVIIRPDLSVVSKKLLPAEAAEQAVQIIEQHKLDVWLYTEREWFIRDPQAPHVAREQWTVKFPPTITTSFDGLFGQVAKIVGVSDDYEAVARCEKDVQQACGTHVSAARSQPYYLDVTHPNANKGEVVTIASELLKISPEEIATIGDMPNDVLMFRKSGVSIAMGNANPEVQKSATFVTASNEEEGFAKAMEDFVLPEQIRAAV
ncbi:MAG: hydrolase [Candidatus Angelobacter sp.]|nr:hydrolase [Candidatus Angelobacter sp.]